LKKSYIYILAFLTGLLPGFFLVFNFMFSDVITLYDRSLSLLVVALAYLVLGAAFGLTDIGSGRMFGLCLCLPAIILALLYSFKETGTVFVNLLYVAAATGAAIAGAVLGTKLSRKRKQ